MIFLFWSKEQKKRSKPKIDKIRAWTSQGASLCPPLSQDRPRLTQDAKVEAPSMPNNTHGQQNQQKSEEIQAWTSKCPLLCP